MLAKCSKCNRWEDLNSKRLCPSCADNEPEEIPTNDGNSLEFGDDD